MRMILTGILGASLVLTGCEQESNTSPEAGAVINDPALDVDVTEEHDEAYDVTAGRPNYDESDPPRTFAEDSEIEPVTPPIFDDPIIVPLETAPITPTLDVEQNSDDGSAEVDVLEEPVTTEPESLQESSSDNDGSTNQQQSADAAATEASRDQQPSKEAEPDEPSESDSDDGAASNGSGVSEQPASDLPNSGQSQ